MITLMIPTKITYNMYILTKSMFIEKKIKLNPQLYKILYCAQGVGNLYSMKLIIKTLLYFILHIHSYSKQ
jgi:hypothetical protein